MRPWRLLHGAEYPAGHRVHGQAVHALSHGVLHTPALEGGQLGQAHWLEDEGWKIKNEPIVEAIIRVEKKIHEFAKTNKMSVIGSFKPENL